MSPPENERRLAALDWMRGLVMVLMALDHASLFFNAGRVALDSSAIYVAGTPLPPAQFFTRWVTHLCAPTFLFLSGAALAMSTSRKQARGQTSWQIDRDLLVRGLLLVGLDLTLMSYLAEHRMLQVLYAIGASMIAMVALRRLPTWAVLTLALAWLAGGEALTSLVWDGRQNASVLAALTVARSMTSTTWLMYPVVPWLAMMALGWVFGVGLLTSERATRKALLGAGVASLGAFAVVRGLRGYGNMFLQAEDHSLVQWLHVSKYPPSLTFVLLELGLAALFIAAFFALQRRVKVRDNGPLLVFGQTALFFYVLHFVMLGLAAKGLGVSRGELPRVYLSAVILLALAYPLCWLYRRAKRARPESLLRFV